MLNKTNLHVVSFGNSPVEDKGLACLKKKLFPTITPDRIVEAQSPSCNDGSSELRHVHNAVLQGFTEMDLDACQTDLKCNVGSAETVATASVNEEYRRWVYGAK